MEKLYWQDVRDLSDEELDSLAKEIENSGVLQNDQWDFEEGSWEFQAHERWGKLIKEQHRRNPPPSLLGSYRPIDSVVAEIFAREQTAGDMLNAFLADAIFNHPPVFDK